VELRLPDVRMVRFRQLMKTPFDVVLSPSRVSGVPFRLRSTSVQTAFGCSHTLAASEPFARMRWESGRRI